MSAPLLFAFVFFFSLVCPVLCDFFSYPAPISFGPSDSLWLPVYPMAALYAPDDSPSNFWHGPNNDDSARVSYDFEFSSQGAVEGGAFLNVALIKSAAFLSDLGIPTEEGIPEVCDEFGNLLMRPNSTYFMAKIPFTGKIAAGQGEFSITETGEYSMLVTRCHERLRQEGEQLVMTKGNTVWLNPYGYLPGNYFGYLPFYLFMAGFFFLVCLAWGALNIIHRDEVAPVQHAISVVLTLCLVEYCVWYADFHHWNSVGSWNFPVVVMAITLTVIRLTLSRVLAVSVCLGWGVVRPSLGGNKLKLVILGFLYFSCQFAMELTSRYAPVDAAADRWRIILVLPVSLLNSVFYWWIFLSLHTILLDLESRKQLAKLQIYRQFSCVLAGSLFSALIYAVYQIWFNVSEQKFIHWSYIWFLDVGVPTVLYSIILLTIAVLWRPTENGSRFMYNELNAANGEFGVEMAEGDESNGRLDLEAADELDEFDAEKARFEIGEDEGGEFPEGSGQGEFKQITGNSQASELYEQ